MRERFSAVSSFSLRMIRRLASLKGAMRPRLVILPRLRIIAVIGMRTSNASHTATSLSHCVGVASRGRSNSSMSFTTSMTFGDVIRAAFSAEDEEAVETRPVINLPRIAAARIANLVRPRNRQRLRRGAAVEDLCVVDSHDGLLSSDAPPTLGTDCFD